MIAIANGRLEVMAARKNREIDGQVVCLQPCANLCCLEKLYRRQEKEYPALPPCVSAVSGKKVLRRGRLVEL